MPRVLGYACGPRQGHPSPLTVIVRAVGRASPSAHSVPSEYMRIRSDQIAGGAAREAVEAKTRAVSFETQKARNLIAAEQEARHAKPRHEAIS